MAGEFYRLAVPQFVQILGAQSRLFAKAEAHCAERGLKEKDWLSTRLHPGMPPLAFQVRQVLSYSAGTLARLLGLPYPPGVDPDSFRICQSQLDAAAAGMLAIAPSELDGAAAREVVFETPRGPLSFSSGSTYLMNFAFPNFYFHATVGYALLHRLGLPVGKNDFLGEKWIRNEVPGESGLGGVESRSPDSAGV